MSAPYRSFNKLNASIKLLQASEIAVIAIFLQCIIFVLVAASVVICNTLPLSERFALAIKEKNNDSSPQIHRLDGE